MQVILMGAQSSDIYMMRNKCLGYDPMYDDDQKPFQGKFKYDYIMWIDSDMVFKVEDFTKLLEDDKDIVSGIYKDGYGEYTCGHLDFKNNCKYPLTEDKLGDKLIEVDYSGMGFMLVKYGVYEKLGFPWFKMRINKVNNYSLLLSEDVVFCTKAKEYKYKIYVDPQVKLGHEKLILV